MLDGSVSSSDSINPLEGAKTTTKRGLLKAAGTYSLSTPRLVEANVKVGMEDQ